jgi:hypothetical protein
MKERAAAPVRGYLNQARVAAPEVLNGPDPGANVAADGEMQLAKRLCGRRPSVCKAASRLLPELPARAQSARCLFAPLTPSAESRLMITARRHGGGSDVQEDPCDSRRGGGCRGRVLRAQEAKPGRVAAAGESAKSWASSAATRPSREYLRGESAGELSKEWLKLAPSDADHCQIPQSPGAHHAGGARRAATSPETS